MNNFYGKSLWRFSGDGVVVVALLTMLEGAVAQDLVRPSSIGIYRDGSRGQVTDSAFSSRVINPGALNVDNDFQAAPTQDLRSEGPVVRDARAGATRPGTDRELSPPADPLAVNPLASAASAPLENYNFRIGPVYFRFGAGLQAEYDDNINFSSSNRISDFVLTPQFYMNAHWPITKYNDLSLRLGLGYTVYLEHSELNSFSRSFALAPGTDINFKFKAGDLYFTIFDRPTVEQNPVDQLTLENTLGYSRFTNSAGINALWDLYDVSVSFGYVHTDSIPLNSEFDNIRYSTNGIFGSVGFRLSDAVTAGVEASASLISYAKNAQNDGGSFSLGTYVQMQVSRSITVKAAAGYQGLLFDEGGSNGDNSDYGGVYANLSLSHRLNRYVAYSIAVGTEADLGTNTNYYKTYFIRHSASWNVFNNVTLSSFISYETADESGPFGQTFNRFGTGFSLGYTLTRKCQVSAFYQFELRDASGNRDSENSINESGDFHQNRIGVNVVYTF